MSLSKQLMLDLLAYADGELDGDAKRRIESILAKDEEAREIVSAASLLGEGIRFAEDERVLPRAADRLVDDVMAKVAGERIGFMQEKTEPQIVRLKRAAPVAALSFAIAMAAVWWLFLRAPMVNSESMTAGIESATPSSSANRSSSTNGASSANAHEERDVATGPEGAELESADSPVSVFFVSTTGDDLNKKAVSSVVVWLGDNGEGTP